MARRGVDTLYLVTDHTSFYERYGWEFLCMVQEEDGPDHLRLYVHRQSQEETNQKENSTYA